MIEIGTVVLVQYCGPSRMNGRSRETRNHHAVPVHDLYS
jgi:hypothetical protein